MKTSGCPQAIGLWCLWGCGAVLAALLIGCGAEQQADTAPPSPDEGVAMRELDDVSESDEGEWLEDELEEGVEPESAMSDGPDDLEPPAMMRAPGSEEQPAAMRREEMAPRDGTRSPDMAMHSAAREDTPARASTEPAAAADSGDVVTPDDATLFTAVKVFYATDRLALESDILAVPNRALTALLGVSVAIGLLMLVIGWMGWRPRLTWSIAALSLLLACVVGASRLSNSWEKMQQVADPGVRYGNQRGSLQYGTCEVTIPKDHVSGEIERPSILRFEVRENADRHVVLQATVPTTEDLFFNDLHETVEQADRSEVFVFVHGYNVTFDGAARRTAQIAHDVKFAGAPIFFSWPSQGGLLKYTVDETNVDWTVPHLRQFLLDVAQRSGASYVNLIAHSMGNRALTEALRELQMQLGGEQQLFNQIILAAPDVDAEIFRRDLAPALIDSARRVTLYSSSNDQALVASKQVHGYARAGDSGAGLVVLPGIETVDVSVLDTSLLGHSYYGSSDPILLDIRQLIRDALPAAQRSSLIPHRYGDLTYWVFEKIRATAIGDQSTGEP